MEQTTTKTKHRAGAKHKKKHKKGQEAGQHTGEAENGAVTPTSQIEEDSAIMEDNSSLTIEGSITLSASATASVSNPSVSTDHVEDESQATATIMNELQHIEAMFDAEIKDAVTVPSSSSMDSATNFDERRIDTDDSPTGGNEVDDGLVNLDDLKDELNTVNIIRSISKSSENSSSSQGLSFENFFDSIESYAENECEILKEKKVKSNKNEIESIGEVNMGGAISEIEDVHLFLTESINSFRDWCQSPTQNDKDKTQLCYAKALALIEKLKRDRDYLLLRQNGMSPVDAKEAATVAAANNFENINAYNLRKNIEIEKNRSSEGETLNGGHRHMSTHKWEIYDVIHPTPSCALDSPVIEHLLQSWTDDRNKIEYFLAWIQCLSFELPENFPKGVQVVDLQSTIRDGFLIMLLPLIRSISLYKVTAFTRISKISSVALKNGNNDNNDHNDNNVTSSSSHPSAMSIKNENSIIYQDDASFAEIYAEEFLKEDTYDIRFKISPTERIIDGRDDSYLENLQQGDNVATSKKDQNEQKKQQSGLFSAFQFFQKGGSSSENVSDSNKKNTITEPSPAPPSMISSGFGFFSPQSKETTPLEEDSSNYDKEPEVEPKTEKSLEEILKEESDSGYRPAFTLFNKILGYDNQKPQENTAKEEASSTTPCNGNEDVQLDVSNSIPAEEGIHNKKSNELDSAQMISPPTKVQESSASLVFSLFTSPIAASAGNSTNSTPTIAATGNGTVTPSSNNTPSTHPSTVSDAMISNAKGEDNDVSTSSSSTATSSILDSVNTFVSPISSLFVGNKELGEEKKQQLEADEAIKKRLGKDVLPDGKVDNVKTMPLRQSSNNPQGIKRNEKANAIAAKLAALRKEKR